MALSVIFSWRQIRVIFNVCESFNYTAQFSTLREYEYKPDLTYKFVILLPSEAHQFRTFIA